MSPRGRRPAGADTRAEIVEAARGLFADQGYDATSLRAVARTAGVDPALVHHYFAGKAELFAEVMALPVDPRVFVDAVLRAPRGQLGEALVRGFFTVWDAPAGRQRMLALLGSAMTNDHAARMIREFLAKEIFARLSREVEPGRSLEEAEFRGGLAASQMVGVAVMRYAIGFPAIATATIDDLIPWLAPTIQRYLVD